MTFIYNNMTNQRPYVILTEYAINVCYFALLYYNTVLYSTAAPDAVATMLSTDQKGLSTMMMTGCIIYSVHKVPAQKQLKVIRV